MHALLPPLSTQPLHGVAATQRIEAAARAELPFNTLMQRAGLAVARLALALAPHAQRAWVLAGPGNNGGDGFEAALHLQAAGLTVHVSFFGTTERLPPDARAAFNRALAAGIAIHNEAMPLGAHDIAIDALLGLGARRAPSGPMAEVITRLNALPCTVLAVDLPSGLNADTGQPFGAACVQATHTLSLLTAKPGLFTAAGRDHAGRVWFDDLGVSASTEAPDAWLSGPAIATRAKRPHASHKGSYGDVAVVGGAAGMSGAAVLAARAAHAAGAGRVYVDLLDAQATPDPTRPELMWRRGWAQGDATTLAQSTVVCGCGGGEAVRHVLPRLLSHVPRLVLDADALNAIAGDEHLQRLLAARASRGHTTVLTPHPLEAARLLRTHTATVQSDRLRFAAELAQQSHCVVVLKGSGTVIARPGAVPHINPTGNAALASPGTGDVLAGWMAGRWAANGALNGVDAGHAAALASVWRHGAVADDCEASPLRAADLVERMHEKSG